MPFRRFHHPPFTIPHHPTPARPCQAAGGGVGPFCHCCRRSMAARIAATTANTAAISIQSHHATPQLIPTLNVLGRHICPRMKSKPVFMATRSAIDHDHVAFIVRASTMHSTPATPVLRGVYFDARRNSMSDMSTAAPDAHANTDKRWSRGSHVYECSYWPLSRSAIRLPQLSYSRHLTCDCPRPACHEQQCPSWQTQP